MISVILIEPAIAGNIGAVARAMANFGFTELVLVRPKCDHMAQEAQGRAKKARPILKKAKVVKDLKGFDYLVGTTSQIGTDFNIPRSPITPNNLAQIIKGKTKGKIGIVFGREGNGLSNKEIEKCDFVVTIPTHKKYHSMNLSHSVSIVLYELYQAIGKDKVHSNITPVTETEKKQVMKMVDQILKDYKFRSVRIETQRKLWKKIIGKLFMSKRESYALMGFLRKILGKK